jgi:hypothetical protein
MTLTQNNINWINSQIGNDTNGFLIKDSTLHHIIEQEIEKFNENPANYNLNKSFIIDQLDDTSGTILSH